MTTHIELKLRCDSKAHFEAWLDAQGLMRDSTDEDGKPTRVPTPGVEIVELGPIVQKPAVYGNGLDQPATVAAVIDTAYHVDIRVHSPNFYQREAMERQGKEEPVLSTDLFETITADYQEPKLDGEKTVYETSALAADFTDKVERVGRMIGDVKLAPAYYDMATGVSICVPATPRHVWC
jgi:hypothetical protein